MAWAIDEMTIPSYPHGLRPVPHVQHLMYAPAPVWPLGSSLTLQDVPPGPPLGFINLHWRAIVPPSLSTSHPTVHLPNVPLTPPHPADRSPSSARSASHSNRSNVSTSATLVTAGEDETPLDHAKNGTRLDRFVSSPNVVAPAPYELRAIRGGQRDLCIDSRPRRTSHVGYRHSHLRYSPLPSRPPRRSLRWVTTLLCCRQ